MAMTPKPSTAARFRAGVAAVLAGIAVVASLGCGQSGTQMGARERVSGAKTVRTADNFLWGVATAGHQWEGGDRHSNWAKWVQGGHAAEPNPSAALGYEMYEQDMDLAKAMGCNSFRLSIEWSRIEPIKGQIDQAEVAHYHRVLDALEARGMKPVVTLMHFAYPAWLDAEGGWENASAVEAFKRHVSFVTKEYGSQIEYYLTFNEPNMLLLCGYGNGTFPPGKKLALFAGAKVAMNLSKGHKAAYEAVHANDPQAKVSFNMYAAEYKVGHQPGTESVTDAAPAVGDAEWFLSQGMGQGETRGKKYLDYVSFDYYSRNWISLPVNVVNHDAWEVYPEGFYKAIKRFHAKTKLPVLIAENGMATYDLKPRKDGWTRGAYLAAHVREMQRAMAEGVPVLGYIHWSISDNYEWGTYTPRFGLYSVESRNGDFRRVPTDGVEAYRRVIEAGGWTPELTQRFPAPGAALTARR